MRTATFTVALLAFHMCGPAARADEPGTTRVLIVALSDYSTATPKMSFLKNPEPDAAAIADQFVALGYGRANVTVLSGAAAARDPSLAPTAANIDAHLKEHVKKSKPSDNLILFLLGHGTHPEGRGAFFIPMHGDLARTETLVSVDAAVDLLMASDYQHVLVCCEMCRSAGRAPVPKAAEGPEVIDLGSATRPRELLKPKSFSILYSCSPGEISYEGEGGGALAVHLIEGLRGAAASPEGVVTLEGLVLHLRQQVVRTVKRLHGADQNPHLIMSSNAPWELARHASRRPDPGAAAAAGLRLVATHVVPPGPGQVGYVRLRLLGADGLPLSGQALTARYRSGGADAVTKLEPTSAEGYAVVPVARPTANADDLVLEVTYDGKAGKVSLVVAGLSDSR